MAKDKKIKRRSASYWQKRMEDVLVANEQTALQYEKRLAKLYTEHKLVIEQQIEAFYQKFAEENKISLLDAKKLLNPKQLRNFHRQQKIYLDKVEELIKKGASLENYKKTLDKLAARARVTRLQELQNNINTELMMLNGKQETELTNTLETVYKNGFNSTAKVLIEGLNLGISFTIPSTDYILKVLRTPWSGKNYSDIIWKNKEQLTNWLNTSLPRHLTMGSTIPEMVKDIQHKLDVNYNSARRLVRTETNYVSNQASMEAYEKSGVVSKYQFIATLDERTSEICEDMNLRIFNTKDSQVGVNTPPMHSNCRSTTIPYLEKYAEEYQHRKDE